MYIDTSLLVAYYVPEKLTPNVDDLIKATERIHISAITRVEFLSALNKKVRMGFFTHKETRIAFNKFEEHISKGFYKWIEINPNHFKNSSEMLLQAKTALRALDAIHLSIVQQERIAIASNDKTLLQSAEAFNISTINI